MSQNPDWIIYLQTLSWDAAARILLAAVLGSIVGLERTWGGHPAGLRTNMMIAVSSCLFTILSIEGFPLRGAAQDTARVAAQIVTGVGFLGAGALLQTKKHVRGLTTAATIWLVAAIGMAVGAGVLFLAIFTAVLSTVLLLMLAPVSKRLERRALERGDTDQPTVGKGTGGTDEDDGDLKFSD
jgi:putative Mg2+ transporter-C (MgtC) family protein